MWGKRRAHNAAQQRSRRRGPVDAVPWHGGAGHTVYCAGYQLYDGGRSGLTHRDRRRGTPLGWPSVTIAKRPRKRWTFAWRRAWRTYCLVWEPSPLTGVHYRDVPTMDHGPDDFVDHYHVAPWTSHE